MPLTPIKLTPSYRIEKLIESTNDTSTENRAGGYSGTSPQSVPLSSRDVLTQTGSPPTPCASPRNPGTRPLNPSPIYNIKHESQVCI